jgi:predicted nucleic acid-binding protein
MSVAAFVDTNVLLYADDARDPSKRERAQTLIEQLTQAKSGRVSMQVLQEYFDGATRKLRLHAAFARSRVETYMRFQVVSLAQPDLLEAIDLHRRYQFAIWDALIVRAALISHCEILYSEDMQDGRRIDGLTIVNPFR